MQGWVAVQRGVFLVEFRAHLGRKGLMEYVCVWKFREALYQ